MLESGTVGSMSDIAEAEGVTPAYVGRMLRLAYLAPAVLEKLLIGRLPPAVSIKDMTAIADWPWAEQVAAVYGEG